MINVLLSMDFVAVIFIFSFIFTELRNQGKYTGSAGLGYAIFLLGPAAILLLSSIGGWMGIIFYREDISMQIILTAVPFTIFFILFANIVGPKNH